MSVEHGEMSVKALLTILIADTVDFLNVGKTMSAGQIAQTIDLILEDYSIYKIDYFILCFNRAKKGRYGKQYDRIDGQVIFNWLAEFDIEYCREIEAARYNEKIQHEKDTKLPEENQAVPMPDNVKELLNTVSTKVKPIEIEKPKSNEQIIIEGFIVDFNELTKMDFSPGKRFADVDGKKLDITEYINFRFKKYLDEQD